MTKDLKEDFPNRLVRVLKTINRKMSDGSTSKVKQAYYVRQASPGDQYAHAELPKFDPNAGGDFQPYDGATVPGDIPPPQPEMPAEPEPPPVSLVVKSHDIPWMSQEEKNTDPIPPEIRRRFSGDKSARAVRPLYNTAPMTGVRPADTMMWDANEPDVLDRLRSGKISSIKTSGAENGVMLVKVDHTDGARYKCYLKMENLNDPFTYEAWGEFYTLDRNKGDLSRRAAAAYEVAKACGLDDLIPPTVVRVDEYGDLDPILSNELIERADRAYESLARATGDSSDVLRKRLKGYGSMQLYLEETSGIHQQEWVKAVFGAPTNALNTLFETIPEHVKIPLLRGAVLDFVLWTGDRCLADLVFCEDDKHPVHFIDNDLSLPDPGMMAAAQVQHGGDYLSPHTHELDCPPMLWSDVAMLVALRGGEDEHGLYEKIGVDVAARIGTDRATELARCLLEHQIPEMNVAGLLLRTRMLRTNSRDVMRNPYLASQYLVEAMTGEHGNLLTQIPGLIEYVNAVMSKATNSEFDFVDRLMSEGEEEDVDQR